MFLDANWFYFYYYINAEDLKSRKGGASLQGFKECYRDLKRKEFITQLLELDNKIPKEIIQLFEQHNLDY